MPSRPWKGQRTPVKIAAADVTVFQPLNVHLRLSGGLLSLLSPSEGRPVTCNMGLWQRKHTRVTSVHESAQGGVRGSEGMRTELFAVVLVTKDRPHEKALCMLLLPCVQQHLGFMTFVATSIRLQRTKQGCHARLCVAGVVEAWTGGSSWDQVTKDCNLDDGDIARLLNR